MNALIALWLPILLSAVVVFIISSIVHMVIKWHASDYNGFTNEDAVRAAIRAGNPKPGHYVVPYCKDMKEMGSETMLQKYREGPIGHMSIVPNCTPNMGKHLGLWFVWSLAISVIAAYLAVRLLGLDHAYARAAAKLIGAVSFIAHGAGNISESIWMGRPWSSTAKYLADAALYGIGAALVFYCLWP
jgi:hypothetical protein